MISGPLGDCIIYRALSVIRLFSSRAHTHTDSHSHFDPLLHSISREKAAPFFRKQRKLYVQYIAYSEGPEMIVNVTHFFLVNDIVCVRLYTPTLLQSERNRIKSTKKKLKKI